MRLIDADALYMAITDRFDYCEDILEVVEAQPTIEPSTNCSEFPNNSDTISRQAAIDALGYCQTYLFDSRDDDKKISLENAEYAIEQLPSAQPEIIRCKDCRYGVDYYHDGDCYCAKPGYELLYFDGSWGFYCANAERRKVTE